MDEVRAEVVAYIRRDLRLPAGIAPVYASTRTAERHRSLIRVRVEAVVVGSRVGEFKDGHELVVLSRAIGFCPGAVVKPAR